MIIEHDVAINFRIPEDLRTRFSAACEKRKTSVSKALRSYVESYVITSESEDGVLFSNYGEKKIKRDRFWETDFMEIQVHVPTPERNWAKLIFLWGTNVWETQNTLTTRFYDDFSKLENYMNQLLEIVDMSTTYDTIRDFLVTVQENPSTTLTEDGREVDCLPAHLIPALGTASKESASMLVKSTITH